MKIRKLSLMFVVVFFVSTTLHAQPPKSGERWNRIAGNKTMADKRFAHKNAERSKFFSEEQQEKMKSIHIETAKNVKPLKNKLRELMAHQKTLTTADKADIKAINKNIDKISDIKTEMAKIMAAQHQQVRSLLTEEQLIKFDNRKNMHTKKSKGKLRGERMERGSKDSLRRGA